MKSAVALMLVQLFVVAQAANAAIVCEGKTSFGNTLKLSIEKNQSAHVEVVNEDGSNELSQDFKNLDETWDGHMTGLMTAPGLSVKYENQYGCIRNVAITTNVRGGGIGYIDTVTVRTCRGGSTPDSICHPTD